MKHGTPLDCRCAANFNISLRTQYVKRARPCQLDTVIAASAGRPLQMSHSKVLVIGMLGTAREIADIDSFNLELVPPVVVPEEMRRPVNNRFLGGRPMPECMAVRQVVRMRKRINLVAGVFGLLRDHADTFRSDPSRRLLPGSPFFRFDCIFSDGGRLWRADCVADDSAAVYGVLDLVYLDCQPGT